MCAAVNDATFVWCACVVCVRSFQPRYVAPDDSKLKPDNRGPARQPERVTIAETFYLTTAINYTNGKYEQDVVVHAFVPPSCDRPPDQQLPWLKSD